MRGKIFFLVISLFFAEQSYAYVPPSDYIVRQISRHHKDFKSIVVKTIVTAFDGDKPTSTFFKETATYDRSSKILQCQTYSEDGAALYFVQRDLSQRNPEINPVSNFLFFEDDDVGLMDVLKTFGIPIRPEGELMTLPSETERRATEKTFMRRWNGKLVWGIGNDSKLDTAIQLAVAKDSFYLRRLVGSKSELQFEDPLSEKGFSYPSEVRLLLGGKIRLASKVDKIIVNPKLTKFPSDSVPGYSDSGNSARSDVKDLIKDYYQYVR